MRRLTTTLGILLCTAALAGQVQPASQVQQTPQFPPTTFPTKGTGLVSGQIVDAHGAGVPNAVVTLNGGLHQVALTIQVGDIPGGPRRTLTNAEGRFVFFEVPAGAYSIDVTKPGFLPGAFGRRRAGGPAQSLRLEDGERKLQLRIPIWEYAAISGRLLDEAGEAMVGVQVRALGRTIYRGRARWMLGPTAVTDDRGVYRFDALEPGEYIVTVAATQVTLPVTLVERAAAEQAAGAASMTTMQIMRSGLASTSLAGATHIGEWAVMAGNRMAVSPTPDSDVRAFVYPTTFYPGTRSFASSQPVVVASGEERSGIDMSMPLTPASTIRGVVTGPDGPAAGVSLQLLPDYADQLSVDGLDIAGAVTDAAGRFAMIGVPEGTYTLRTIVNAGNRVGVPPAATGAPVEQGLWLMQPVTVTGSESPTLELTLRPGVTVRGQIEFHGSSPRPGPEIIQKLFAGLEPLDPNMPRAQGTYQVNFDRTGHFVITNVVPGRYAVRYAAFLEERRAMPEWETVGGLLGGKDLSSMPFSITADVDGIVIRLTDDPSELTGTVRSADGSVDATAAVVLYPTDRGLWNTMPSFTRRMRMVRASESGSFMMRGVPPGDYFIAAIPDEQSSDWQDPRVLERLAREAVRLTITDGEKKTQDLRMRAPR